MPLQDLVIRSQLIPPRQRKGVVRRPRLESALLSVLDYPVVVVHAGTGYGKSTALSTLAGMVDRLAWYTITEPDRDPLLFLAHLICAFEQGQPAGCAQALQILESAGGRVTPAALTPLLNALTTLDQEAVLVLDDYHLVANVPEIAGLVERVVDYAPPRLHVVISSRQPPTLPALTRWQAKGKMLTLTRADLVFTPGEVEALFRDEYRWPITPEQARRLAAETEGWAIALQMVGRSLREGAASGLEDILGRLPSTLDSLFDYLAQDVLARQPEAVQRFLVTTSVLREMEGPACDHLLGVQGSVDTLCRLYEDGLFVVSLGDQVYRYQRLFHDFLRAHLQREPARWQALHLRAAGHFRAVGHREESVYHLLEAGEHIQAAELLEEIGAGLVALGRFDSLSSWIARLPEEVQSAHPALDLLLGDVLRLRAQFDEALRRYQAAEARYAATQDRLGQSRALRGQAEVYLDTVRPLTADGLLENALRLLDPMVHRDEAATLLDLLAENKLNLGSPDEAQALHHEAQLLRTETDPGELYLEARAMLRTGHLADGRLLLERRAEEESQSGPSRPPRFHREALVLLSLICALQGDAEAAELRARQGIALGRQLKSAFVEAVGYMRLGHAFQLRDAQPWERDPAATSGDWWAASPAVCQARACYERAIDQARAFNVLRTYVEPLWGLCRLHGYAGDLVAARRCADEALEIGARSGDEWICDLVRVTMGAGYALHGVSGEAQAWLARAQQGFERVGDRFGRSAAALWLALDAWWHADPGRSFAILSELLPQVREQGWEALLIERTFLGLKDDQAALPLLIDAHRQGIEAHYLGRLLEGLGLADAEYHPGYTLWVRALGRLALWRGDQPVADRDWQRDKARQVFHLLLTHRGQWFYREQIVEHLWPDLAPDAADRDFRVAYTSLTRALEPDRPRTAAAFFVPRHGSVYGLRPGAGVRVDVDQFESLAGSEDPELLRRAVSLYEDYLPECLYEDWSAAERQRLRHAFLVASERLARHLLRAKAWQETIQVCEAILLRDDCYEPAYRLLMRAHAALGDRAQVQAVYQRCAAALRDGLGVDPSQTTTALLSKLS
jgi:LuxR family maltose regulon positive regulatory protein